MPGEAELHRRPDRRSGRRASRLRLLSTRQDLITDVVPGVRSRSWSPRRPRPGRVSQVALQASQGSAGPGHAAAPS